MTELLAFALGQITGALSLWLGLVAGLRLAGRDPGPVTPRVPSWYRGRGDAPAYLGDDDLAKLEANEADRPPYRQGANLQPYK